jgi:hypothetical protein
MYGYYLLLICQQAINNPFYICLSVHQIQVLFTQHTYFVPGGPVAVFTIFMSLVDITKMAFNLRVFVMP